jgi:serine/threonine-protein kinase HipA
MKRSAKVYNNDQLAGTLIQEEKEYVFRYNDLYYNDSDKPSISLTLPKTKQEYRSEILFPFFFNMLAEGVNRELQSRRFRIDESDYFGLLLATAQYDTIGAITLEEITA